MRKQPTKRRRISPSSKRTTLKDADHQKIDVTPEQVIDDLLRLFSRLGVSTPNLRSHRVRRRKAKRTVDITLPFSPAIGELLTSWHQNPAYLDDRGNPVPIKFHAPKRSFFKLAQESVPNFNASVVLEELERLGAVSIDKADFIKVHMRSLPVYEDKRLAIQHTLTSLDGFIKTLHHNLHSAPSNSDQLFHRIAWTGDFDIKQMPKLKIRMKRHGQSFLESFDNWLGPKSLPKPRARSPRSDRAQVSIGVYLSVT